ncbi:MAG: sterol desaturase family protein [Blastocatellia bacterium]|nr:sterol desaturase family protein [Blastocatellia bacterium]
MESGWSETVQLELLLGMGLLWWVVESVYPLQPRPTRRAQIYKFNLALTALVLVINFILAGVIFWLLRMAQDLHWGMLSWLGFSGWGAALLGICGLDGCAYLAHVTMHRNGLGWRCHQLHHSETHVDVTTALRQHPGETLIRVGFQIGGGVILGVSPGVFVGYVTLSALQAQFEHANFLLPEPVDRILRWVWVTPNMHKLHHATLENQDHSNYANLFSMWDRLGRTFRPSSGLESVVYGTVPARPQQPPISWWEVWKI